MGVQSHENEAELEATIPSLRGRRQWSTFGEPARPILDHDATARVPALSLRPPSGLDLRKSSGSVDPRKTLCTARRSKVTKEGKRSK